MIINIVKGDHDHDHCQRWCTLFLASSSLWPRSSYWEVKPGRKAELRWVRGFLFVFWLKMWRRWRFWWQLFNDELLLRVDKRNDVDEIRDEGEDENIIEKGGAVGDCLTVCCCPGCAHLQQYKEVIIISLMFTLLHNHHHHQNSIVTTKDFVCLKVNPQKSLVCGESTIQ